MIISTLFANAYTRLKGKARNAASPCGLVPESGTNDGKKMISFCTKSPTHNSTEHKTDQLNDLYLILKNVVR